MSLKRGAASVKLKFLSSGALMNRRRTGPLEGEVAFSGFQWRLKAKSPSDFRLSKADSEAPSTHEDRVGKNPEGLSRSFQLFETLLLVYLQLQCYGKYFTGYLVYRKRFRGNS